MEPAQTFPGVLAGPPRLYPLQRLAAVMCFVVAIGGALAEILLLWVWMFPEHVEKFVVPHIGLTPGTAAVDVMTRLFGFGITMMPVAVLFYALNQAFELFDGYRQGDVFSADAPKRLRRIGFSMMLLGVLRPLTGALLSLALTAHNPPGHKMLVIGLGLEDYMIALFGGLIVAIGHVLVEANAVARDHAQII